MKSLITYFKMIKFEHSLFALPFALSSMLVASNGIPPIKTILFIILAMVSARSAAMGINRYVDVEIDAQNPRTSNRHLPKGEITLSRTKLYIIISVVVYFFAAFMLNNLTFILSPIPIIVFLIYSYSKRYTSLCHILLGISLGLSPLGAWIAVTGSVTYLPFLLSIAVLFWASGFDILYAIQDINFDRKYNLFSIPAFLGVQLSLITARIFHLISLIFLLIFFSYSNLGYIYLSGVIISGAFMIYEHSLISKDNLAKLDTAFFNINAYISITLFIFTTLDVLV